MLKLLACWRWCVPLLSGRWPLKWKDAGHGNGKRKKSTEAEGSLTQHGTTSSLVTARCGRVTGYGEDSSKFDITSRTVYRSGKTVNSYRCTPFLRVTVLMRVMNLNSDVASEALRSALRAWCANDKSTHLHRGTIQVSLGTGRDDTSAIRP